MPATLTAIEVRVLGVLIEKEAITPDAYPMTLNALAAGCNQLTAREPVMQLSPKAVQDTLTGLAAKKLIGTVHQAGARVPKIEHRIRIVYAIERHHALILALLMLRGPQTAAELRQRAERLFVAEMPDQFTRGLQFLVDKYPPLVEQLAKAPGNKESRYRHCLSRSADMHQAVDDDIVPPDDETAAQSAFESGSVYQRLMRVEAGHAALQEEVLRLRAELAALRPPTAAGGCDA